jgi:hypothetical protein
MFEKRVREKIAQLIERADVFADRPTGGRDERWLADGHAWLTEAINVVELALPDRTQVYRLHITNAIFGTVIERVLRVASTLRSLLADVDAGLVGTITNKVRAKTFDNFLDHAVEYRNENRKVEAGVIAGVVFEDTMRKIYADKVHSVARPELEQVIIELTKRGVITEEQAKQARVAARPHQGHPRRLDQVHARRRRRHDQDHEGLHPRTSGIVRRRLWTK